MFGIAVMMNQHFLEFYAMDCLQIISLKKLQKSPCLKRSASRRRRRRCRRHLSLLPTTVRRGEGRRNTRNKSTKTVIVAASAQASPAAKRNSTRRLAKRSASCSKNFPFRRRLFIANIAAVQVSGIIFSLIRTPIIAVIFAIHAFQAKLCKGIFAVIAYTAAIEGLFVILVKKI